MRDLISFYYVTSLSRRHSFLDAQTGKSIFGKLLGVFQEPGLILFLPIFHCVLSVTWSTCEGCWEVERCTLIPMSSNSSWTCYTASKQSSKDSKTYIRKRVWQNHFEILQMLQDNVRIFPNFFVGLKKNNLQILRHFITFLGHNQKGNVTLDDVKSSRPHF